MVVSLGPSLGQIQDGGTPHMSWFPLEELLLGALPMLTWVANSMFVRGRIWSPDPTEGQALPWANVSVGS